MITARLHTWITALLVGVSALDDLLTSCFFDAKVENVVGYGDQVMVWSLEA